MITVWSLIHHHYLNYSHIATHFSIAIEELTKPVLTVLYLLTTTKSIQQSVIWIWQFAKRFQRPRTSYWSQDSKTIIQYEWQSSKLITDMDIHCILNVYLFHNIDKWIYLSKNHNESILVWLVYTPYDYVNGRKISTEKKTSVFKCLTVSCTTPLPFPRTVHNKGFAHSVVCRRDTV